MGFDQPLPKTSSTTTGEYRKSKSRIGEGFIAEISELGTFEKAAPMETWSMRNASLSVYGELVIEKSQIAKNNLWTPPNHSRALVSVGCLRGVAGVSEAASDSEN